MALAAGTPRVAAALEIAINCGGPDYESPAGRLFAEDRAYEGDSRWGYLERRNTVIHRSGAAQIRGTRDPELHRTSRVSRDSIAYRFDVPNGDYAVSVFAADLAGHDDSLNQMRVRLEGVLLEDSLVPHRPNRRNQVSQWSWLTSVNDGILELTLLVPPDSDPDENVQIQGLVVRTAEGPDEIDPPPSVGVLRVVPSYSAVLTSWPVDEFAWRRHFEMQRRLDGRAWESVCLEALHSDRYLDLIRDCDGGGLPTRRGGAFPEPSSRSVRYRVRSVDLWGRSGPWTESEVVSPISPTDSNLDLFGIELAPDSVRTHALNLQRSPSIKIYTRADVSFRLGRWGRDGYEADSGEPGPEPMRSVVRLLPRSNAQRCGAASALTLFPKVRTRFRGASTLVLPKKSRKLNFRRVQPFCGMDKVNLNSGATDYTMIRERAAFALWEAAGQPCPRVVPVNLFVNGVYEGVHQQIEQVDEFWLDRHGLSREGNLYKCYGGLTSRSLLGPDERYVHKWGPDEEKNGLRNFIRSLNETPPDEIDAYFDEHLDVDAALTWFALNVLLANFDFTYQNYYLYESPDHRWLVIPWDMDLAFGRLRDLVTPRTRMSLTYGAAGDPETPTGWENQLLTQIRGNRTLYRRYLEHVRSLVDSIFNEASLLHLLESCHRDLSEDYARDPWRLSTSETESVGPAFDFYRRFVNDRLAEVRAELLATERP